MSERPETTNTDPRPARRRPTDRGPEPLSPPEGRGGAGPRPTEPPVVYPAPEVRLQFGDVPLTASMARDLLGWETEDEFVASVRRQFPDYTEERVEEVRQRFAEDATLRDYGGQLVRCWNNRNNRQLDMTWCRQLALDVLHSGPGLPPERRRWQLNLETIVVGRRGTVMSGQHRLVALVVAAQMWAEEGERHGYWLKIWPTEPTLDTLVACGADERPEVFRTLDNVKPRTLYDVIMTNPFFVGLSAADRRAACKALESAVGVMWDRTEARANPYHPLRTHAESLEFISRHPRLCECVTTILGYCKGTRLETILGVRGTGTLAAMLYLMGCCDSDGGRYAAAVRAGTAGERGLRWVNTWAKAKEFWREVADDNGPLRRLLDVHRCPMPGDPSMSAMSGFTFGADRNCGNKTERLAVLCKAWNVYRTGAPVAADDLRLEYRPDFDGDGRVTEVALNEGVTVGGIDTGGQLVRDLIKSREAVAAAQSDDDDDDDDDDDGDGGDEGGPRRTTRARRRATPDQAPVDPQELYERARRERLARGIAETREDELEIRARLGGGGSDRPRGGNPWA